MTNPYVAPDETPDSDKTPRSRFGMLGCGCAVALLGLVTIGFLSLFIAVDDKSMPAPVGIPLGPTPPAPTSTTIPAPTSAEPTTEAP
ncbi:MAG: hypothetical protein P1U77_08750 [Rubripirellula sp.]|jgi:hypothetical protein|nr:hypothetical protein [Rubripirellula sp.]